MKPALNSRCTESMVEVRVHSDSSYESTSNPPRYHDSFSAFGDTACGKPAATQHLMLDFTPIEEMDNDFVQRKCCAFWEFINNRKELHKLMVLPCLKTVYYALAQSVLSFCITSWGSSGKTLMLRLELAQKAVIKVLTKKPRLYPTTSLYSLFQVPTERDLYNMSSSSEMSQIEKPNRKTLNQTETTAVTMLEFVEEKGLIDRTFEARLPKSNCSLGSREYIENEGSTQQTLQGQNKICKCKGVCRSCNKSAATPEPSLMTKMCGKMQEWNRQHPKCRPICKSRRREWKGKQQNTSAELLLDRKPLPECFKRWPKKVFPNGPCPLFARSRHVTVCPRGEPRVPRAPVVRLCQAPIDDTVNTPYLKYAEVAKLLGAWESVKACCAFCACGGCCACGARRYEPRDAERALRRRSDMRLFDARVKADCMHMRIMYDQP